MRKGHQLEISSKVVRNSSHIARDIPRGNCLSFAVHRAKRPLSRGIIVAIGLTCAGGRANVPCGGRAWEAWIPTGRTERTYGRFFRRIAIPEHVKAENAVAAFKNGVLEIEMPAIPVPEVKKRTIDIKG